MIGLDPMSRGVVYGMLGTTAFLVILGVCYMIFGKPDADRMET